MKDFFKYMLASMAGFILAYFVIFIIMFFIVMGTIGYMAHKGFRNISETENLISEKTVLKIDLKEPIVEYIEDNPLYSLSFLSDDINLPRSLKSIIDNIKRAKNDKKIAGIYLDLTSVPSAYPTLLEVRNALLDFKKSGKFIYAYSDIYTKQGYYIASVADSIFLQPKGMLLFNGFSTEMAFFKGTLDKLNMEPRLIRAGKFKSAGESFTQYKMSKENYEQISSLINSIYNQYISSIALSRKIDTSELKKISNNFLIKNPAEAIKYKLVDKLCYYDQFYTMLKKVTAKEKVQFITLSAYSKNADGRLDKAVKTDDRIALIYAVGEIGMNGNGSSSIDPEKLNAAIYKARTDKNVKAIVIRINSPGGSALASDVIWREVKLAKQSKPVIISMGNVAASGGYYISCPADYILAEPTTITGSIGVFGMFINMEKFWKDKLGVTFDRYKTGKYSDLGNPNREMTKDEEDIIRYGIDSIYTTFKSDVATGRKLSMDEVEKIAQGRVWTGEQALKIHLVDQLGGLYDAIEVAAKMGKITQYKLMILPKPSNPFEKFIHGLGMSNLRVLLKKEILGKDYEIYEKASQAESMNGVYMLEPALMDIR